MAATDTQRAVSQDVGIASRDKYFAIFAAVVRVEKASLPPPREAAGTLSASGGQRSAFGKRKRQSVADNDSEI